jgi:TRAP-type mannitol/chloroaromatic compound transport system permease small subunit
MAADSDQFAGIAWIDRANSLIGRAVSWLTLAMVLVTVAIVLLRYVFSIGWIWIQESVTWMHAAVFMLGAAWALRTGDHVRVDIFYKKMPPRGQALVDLLGSLLLLLPFCGFILYEAWPYVLQSFELGETSREASGLAAIWLLKSVILIAAAQIALQGVSELVRAWRRWLAT